MTPADAQAQGGVARLLAELETLPGAGSLDRRPTHWQTGRARPVAAVSPSHGLFRCKS